MELFPFMIPEKHSGLLHIVPAKVTVIEQVKEERSLPERHKYCSSYLCVCTVSSDTLSTKLFGTQCCF